MACKSFKRTYSAVQLGALPLDSPRGAIEPLSPVSLPATSVGAQFAAADAFWNRSTGEPAMKHRELARIHTDRHGKENSYGAGAGQASRSPEEHLSAIDDQQSPMNALATIALATSPHYAVPYSASFAPHHRDFVFPGQQQRQHVHTAAAVADDDDDGGPAHRPAKRAKSEVAPSLELYPHSIRPVTDYGHAHSSSWSMQSSGHGGGPQGPVVAAQGQSLFDKRPVSQLSDAELLLSFSRAAGVTSPTASARPWGSTPVKHEYPSSGSNSRVGIAPMTLASAAGTSLAELAYDDRSAGNELYQREPHDNPSQLQMHTPPEDTLHAQDTGHLELQTHSASTRQPKTGRRGRRGGPVGTRKRRANNDPDAANGEGDALKPPRAKRRSTKDTRAGAQAARSQRGGRAGPGLEQPTEQVDSDELSDPRQRRARSLDMEDEKDSRSTASVSRHASLPPRLPGMGPQYWGSTTKALTESFSRLKSKYATVCFGCKFSSNTSAGDRESWISCNGCSEWFHFACAGFKTEREVRSVDKYFCKSCKPKFGSTTFVRKSSRAHAAVDYAELNEGVVRTSEESPEHHYIKPIKNGTMKFLPDKFARLPPELVNADFFAKCGSWTDPVMIPAALNPRPSLPGTQNVRSTSNTPTGESASSQVTDENMEWEYVADNGQDKIDMVIPNGLTVRRVAELYGPDEKVEVIDVKSQEGADKRWNMRKWADYYEDQGEKIVRNVISLEVSASKLGRLIQRPKVVRELDLQDSVWPLEETLKGLYPKVQFYCLMSVADCYTDFHIDFGGSSVYYHIVKGKKTFFFIPPKKHHLKKYEDWCLSPAQNWTFLPDQVKECYRVDLSEGDTMLIPSGWIHAVWTPEDSLVIGGNFLTRLHYPTQIKVTEIEKNTKVPRKFRYPHFQKIMWYAALDYLATDPMPEPVHQLLQAGKHFCRDRPVYQEVHNFGHNSREGPENYNSRYYPEAEVQGLPDLVKYIFRTVMISLGKLEGITAETKNAVTKAIPRGSREPLELAKEFAMWVAWKRGNEEAPQWARADSLPALSGDNLKSERRLSVAEMKKLERQESTDMPRQGMQRQARKASVRSIDKDMPKDESLPDQQVATEASTDNIPQPVLPVSSYRRNACQACRKRRVRCKHKNEPSASRPFANSSSSDGNGNSGNEEGHSTSNDAKPHSNGSTNTDTKPDSEIQDQAVARDVTPESTIVKTETSPVHADEESIQPSPRKAGTSTAMVAVMISASPHKESIMSSALDRQINVETPPVLIEARPAGLMEQSPDEPCKTQEHASSLSGVMPDEPRKTQDHASSLSGVMPDEPRKTQDHNSSLSGVERTRGKACLECRRAKRRCNHDELKKGSDLDGQGDDAAAAATLFQPSPSCNNATNTETLMASYDTRLDLQTSDDSSGHDDGMVDAAVDITSAPNGRDVEEPAVGIAGEASLRDLPKRVLRQSGLGAVQADGVPLNVRSPAERKSTAGPIDKSSILRSKQAEPLLTNGHGHASEHDRTLTEGLDTNVSTNSSAGTGTFAANAPVNGWKPASKRRLSRSEDVSLLETPNKRRSSDRQRQLEQSKDKSASDSSSPPQPSVAKSRPRITAAAPSSTGKGAKTDTAKVKADSARVKIDVTKAKTDMTKAKTDMAKVKTDMAKAKTVDAPGAHKAPSERKHNNDTKANGTIPNGAGVVEDVESLKLAKELAELEFGLRKRSR